MKVLIIDDRRFKSETIKNCLNEIGINDIHIEEFRNLGCLEIEKSIEEKRPYDLIILDMQMPAYPDGRIYTDAGLFILKRMQHKHIKTPVIMCSSDDVGDMSNYPMVIGSVTFNIATDMTSLFRDIIETITNKRG